MIRKYCILFLGGILLFLYFLLLPEVFSTGSLRTILPVLSYQSTSKNLTAIWAENKAEEWFPQIVYAKSGPTTAKRKDEFLLKKLKPVELLTMMEVENTEQIQKTEEPAKETKPPAVQPLLQETETEEGNEEIETSETGFTPHTLQSKVDLEALSDYETLLKSFYTVDRVAMVGSDTLDAAKLANIDLRITKNKDAPQILIYHTHSQEGFLDSVPGDDSTTVMAVGEHLAQILQTEYGYKVLHYGGKYDVESRDNAYSKALPEMEQLLKENPSIEVVIDLHRDAVSDESKKFVMDLDGRPTARFMFFNGVSCTKKTGKIAYLENPYQQENLAFSFQLKKAAEEYYPGLTRKNYIHGYRYNMHLCARTLLLELGAQNNTLQEALNACDPIAHLLDMVLSGA